MNYKHIILYTIIIFFSACGGEADSVSPVTKQAIDGRNQTVSDTTAWHLLELPLKTANSQFKVNLPHIRPDSDWVVGIKPIKDGEQGKMSIGILSWKSKDGENSVKSLSKIENYPVAQRFVTEDQATLNASVNPDQTLVIYMEISPATKAIFNAGGAEISADFPDAPYIVFNGKIEKAANNQADSLIALITTARAKILERDLTRNDAPLSDK